MTGAIAAAPAGAQRASTFVGNALLDKQHFVIVALLQSATDGLSASDDRTFMDGLREIVELAERHCAAEEQLLAVNGYEWLEQHQEEHARGIRRLKAIGVRVASGQMRRADALEIAKRWFRTHLEDMDLPASDSLAIASWQLASRGDAA